MSNIIYFSNYELETKHDYEMHQNFITVDGVRYKIVEGLADGLRVVKIDR